ncbi:Integrin-linked protein kinase family [Prunus dulcis]|uniref:Integrin-linked protein kinase family n=1 Tax=Prunus dulcis TaxID=3755 RepID=A0A4Y1R0D1_PRUDU|nr:Integrin-linked protein kinase family [Prunus dulcis]
MQKKSQKVGLDSPYRLLYCSSKGDKAGVMHELEKGVKPNLADYDKRTALHLASCEGCTEIVDLLLHKGADVNSTDRWGRTPLSDARSFSHEAICKILEARGGIDPVGLDSQLPCYEIEHTEVNMDEATLIGEGSYGEIYLVKWRGTEVAAKTIRSSIASNPTVKTIFLKELALWQKLRHPNIVQFLGVLRHTDRLIFLTEYLCNTFHVNLLLTTMFKNVAEDEAGRLKVTDFGLSKIAQQNDVSGYKMTGRTDRYMAPEVYRRESYGTSIDIFSFALIVHEMFLGGPPNLAEDPEKIADKRAYEDSRPPLFSYLYPEPIRT